jgi:DNA-binding SARP family transcriptional activator/tetratricopeptide (TPR) repeat protein
MVSTPVDAVGEPRREGNDVAAAAHHAEPDEAPVVIRLLGPLDVMIQGRSVPLKGPRTYRLLALLAASCDEIVSLDSIIDCLWEEPPDSARQQVHNVVSSLRRALNPTGSQIEVVTSNVGYRLSLPKRAVDIFEFQALVQEADSAAAEEAVDEAIRLLRDALAQWRGPALSGLSGRQLTNAATLLNEQRLVAVEHLAELHLRRGDGAAITADLLELVKEFPFRESLRAILMRVLQQSGRQVEALAVFEDGRRQLADELGLDPGPLMQAAHRQVLRSHTASEAASPSRPPSAKPRAAAAASAAPATAAPAVGHERRFLPRDIAEFTGRDKELRQLVDSAGQSGATALVISAINGMGGVGKTTLAVHMAHRLADDYPDGQYFVDLQGFSAGARPWTPAQALNLLLRSNGVPPELIPADEEGRSALWRSRLAGLRVLLLLDNAVDVSQIRPLLPGTAGSLVLISSRRRMASLEGSIPMPLDIMPQADAVSLFSRIIGPDRAAAEPQDVVTAIELCGRLPLAIQIAAARLRDRPAWSVAHAVDQLRDQTSRPQFLSAGDRDVMGVLAWSYRELTTDQQRLFRLLSVHPGPDVDANVAAALMGGTLYAAVSGLDELFEVNLLQQPAPGRYRFHDLVRDCSRNALDEHGDAAERAAAELRVLDYYLTSANTWCKPIAKNSFRFDIDTAVAPGIVKEAPSSAVAVQLLEAEYRNLTAAVQFALDAAHPSHAWQLVCSLLPYFDLLNYGPEAEALCRQALDSARATGSAAGESVCLMGLAQSRRAQGANTEARELALRAIGLSHGTGDRAREVNQRTGLGRMYLDDNLFDDAFSCFTSAMELARACSDREAEADLANNLGVICRELGRLQEAREHFDRAVALDAAAGASWPQALTLSNIGQVLYLQGRYAEAATQFETALRMSRAANSALPESLALVGICTVRRILGDLAASLDVGREALDSARGALSYELEGDALNALGDTYLGLGDLETADTVFDQVNTLGLRYGSPRYVARADEGRAHTAAARGDVATAEAYWRKALATHPGGVVDAAGARRHLAAPGSGATCWRCASAHGTPSPSPSPSPEGQR